MKFCLWLLIYIRHLLSPSIKFNFAGNIYSMSKIQFQSSDDHLRIHQSELRLLFSKLPYITLTNTDFNLPLYCSIKKKKSRVEIPQLLLTIHQDTSNSLLFRATSSFVKLYLNLPLLQFQAVTCYALIKSTSVRNEKSSQLAAVNTNVQSLSS